MSDLRTCKCGAKQVYGESYARYECGTVIDHDDPDVFHGTLPDTRCLQRQMDNLKVMIEAIHPSLR